MTRAARLGLVLSGAAAALLVTAGIAGLLTLRSAWFRDQLRERIVAEAERSSGGNVELESFDFDWKGMRAEFRGFVLRGTEPRAAKPLFRADSIVIGLRIVSVLKRDIDLASLVVVRPEVHIVIGPDGASNLPRPRLWKERDTVEEILKLAVDEFELRDGALDFDSQRIPVNVRGQHLGARVVYEAAAPRYRGEIAAHGLQIGMDGARPALADVEIRAALERNRVEVARASVALGKSSLVFSGAVDNFSAPRTSGEIDAVLGVDDAARYFPIPLVRQGQIRVAGKGWFSGPEAFSFTGQLEGRQLGVDSAGVHLTANRLGSVLRVEPRSVTLDNLRADTLDGAFRGRVRLEDFRRLTVEGAVDGVTIASLGRIHAEAAKIPWNGSVSGSVKLEADVTAARIAGARLEAEFKVAPQDGPLPIEGLVSLVYDQKAGTLRFEKSRLATPATTIGFSGALGERLQVDLRTSNLDDLVRAATAFSEDAPASIPVSLDKGFATFRGSVSGPLSAPRIQGRIGLARFTYDNRLFQKLSAEVELTRTAALFRSLAVEREGARLEGRGVVGLKDWTPYAQSALSGTVTLRGEDLKTLAREAGPEIAIGGLLTASAKLGGTLEMPEIAANVEVAKFEFAGESFEHARARLRYVPGVLEIDEARLESAKARIDGKLAYDYAKDDPRTGKLRFETAGERLPLASFRALRELAAGFDGVGGATVAGALALDKGEPRLTELNGTVTLRDVTFEQRPAGSLEVGLTTRNGQLDVNLAGKLRGAEVRGSGAWKLEGEYPGSASLEFTPVRFTDLGELLAPDRSLPFGGTVQGRASLSGSLRKPEEMQGEVRIEKLELRPRARERNLPAAVKDLSLRNAEPLLLAVDSKGVHIRSARFVGRDTNLEALGTLSARARNAWSLEVRGGLDLALISTLYPELVTSGRATLNATVRGTVDQPIFGGRMELQNASVFLADVPSGIENANGVLFFDRNRATIERLTAQAGGGQLRLSGFVGIGAPELVYRLQAEAEKVRIRYPEGVSTTVTGSVSLTGTSTRSLLAGTAMIERAAFNPRMDIGSLLAESTRPVTTPVPSNPALAGMQFDIRVTSAPTLELQTSLAKNIQADADLRLRGSAARPIVLGRVTVNSGEIQFFGTRYSITRGEVSFYNPARIEPVVDLDLETRVRGVIVNLTFTGPMSKLNMSYRSDPPLQSQEIIALLAVGRDPGSNPTQAGAQTTYGQGGLPSGADSLIGQAISTPISSRLQRFFGVSRLKIDPHLTGTEISPQARLTIEQQISRDITLTYVTNLSEAKEQVVRLEWDMNRQWSVVAVRDENGTFGIDFLYKKRFR